VRPAGRASDHPGTGPTGPARDEQDAAVVIAVLAALAAGPEPAATEPAPRSVWADPAHRLGVSAAGDHRWWASGLPR
jgi:hypothetical protein